jgi:hypothetical protein
MLLSSREWVEMQVNSTDTIPASKYQENYDGGRNVTLKGIIFLHHITALVFFYSG